MVSPGGNPIAEKVVGLPLEMVGINELMATFFRPNISLIESSKDGGPAKVPQFI